MLAGMIARPRATSERTNSASNPSAESDELHLGRDDAPARVMKLGHVVLAAAARDPLTAQRRQPLPRIVALRPARVVHEQRRLSTRERNLAHWNVQRTDVHLARIGWVFMVFLTVRLKRRPDKPVRPVRRRNFAGTALPSPVSTGAGSKGLVSIAAVISGIPLAATQTIQPFAEWIARMTTEGS